MASNTTVHNDRLPGRRRALLKRLRLDDDDIRVLELLIQGYTDRAIAQHTSTSPRTVRRRVAEVGGKLGVVGRTSVAAAVAQLGIARLNLSHLRDQTGDQVNRQLERPSVVDGHHPTIGV